MPYWMMRAQMLEYDPNSNVGLARTLGGPVVQVMCLAYWFSYWTAVCSSYIYILKAAQKEHKTHCVFSVFCKLSSLYSEDRWLVPVVFSRKGFPRKNMCLVFDLYLHYLLTTKDVWPTSHWTLLCWKCVAVVEENLADEHHHHVPSRPESPMVSLCGQSSPKSSNFHNASKSYASASDLASRVWLCHLWWVFSKHFSKNLLKRCILFTL